MNEYDEGTERLIKLLDDSLSVAAIARELETSTASVYRMGRRSGIDVTGRRLMNYSSKTIEARAMAMKPLDAVEYLLGIVRSFVKDSPYDFEDAATLGITGRPAFIFHVLNNRLDQIVSKEALYTAMYSDRFDPPELKIIDVYISHLRKQLPKEYKLITIWGHGYRLVKCQPE